MCPNLGSYPSAMGYRLLYPLKWCYNSANKAPISMRLTRFQTDRECWISVSILLFISTFSIPWIPYGPVEVVDNNGLLSSEQFLSLILWLRENPSNCVPIDFVRLYCLLGFVVGLSAMAAFVTGWVIQCAVVVVRARLILFTSE